MAYRDKSVCHNYDILSERLQLCGGSLLYVNLKQKYYLIKRYAVYPT